MIGPVAASALLGGALGAAESIPYLRDTWRRTTSPHRGSWLIWAVIEIVAVEAQRADGARWSLVPLVTQALGTCLVFALSVTLGSGGVSRAELALMALAGLGVLGWFAVDEPMVATICVIIADFIAAMMMVPKTWRDPASETMSTYALASLAGVASIGAVGALSPALLMYPVYFALVNAFLTLVIAYRRGVLSREQRDLETRDPIASTRAYSWYSKQHQQGDIMKINNQLDRQRLALGLAAAFAFSAAFATMAAQPASAAAVIVPPGCGSYSGNPLPAGWTLEDHSGDASALGTLASPHYVPATFGMITIGTRFGDVIVGNDVNEVQCGLGGSDWLRGSGGDDELYGGNGPDSLMGEENSDFESGGHARDTLYGDDGTDSHGNLDFADELQGGDRNDWLFGGDGFDTIRGGNGASDEVDGGAAGADCAADLEVGLATC